MLGATGWAIQTPVSAERKGTGDRKDLIFSSLILAPFLLKYAPTSSWPFSQDFSRNTYNYVFIFSKISSSEVKSHTSATSAGALFVLQKHGSKHDSEQSCPLCLWRAHWKVTLPSWLLCWRCSWGCCDQSNLPLLTRSAPTVWDFILSVTLSRGIVPVSLEPSGSPLTLASLSCHSL